VSAYLKGSFKKTAILHPSGDAGPSRVVTVGLGKRAELDPERARIAAAVGFARAKDAGATALAWVVPANGDAGGIAAALAEGCILAGYRFDRYKTGKDEEGEDESRRVQTLEVVAADDVGAKVAEAAIVAEGQNRARDLQNLPSNVATPVFLAERAAEIAAQHDTLEVELIDRDGIVERGMGALAAVAQGTYAEPRLIVLRYAAGTGGPHLGFVGKAVTFDTGGISIKPSAKMHEMKFDMSGGAAVIESLGAIAQLGLPVTVTGVVPATENMPSGRSMRPGDIVTAMNGTTIEINNTDAEGRLILSDALCYAVEQGVDRIVDLATLTGAIIVALGSTYAGLFSNDDDWCAEVKAAGDATGEIGWQLPLRHKEYEDLIKGEYADISNAPEARKASSIVGAEFLRRFVDDKPWVHMDIAGTAWGMDRPYVRKGASGFGVRTLIELASRAT
jgi:leucyl aminopeptidase